MGKALDDGAGRVTLVLNRPPAPRDPEPWISAWLVDRRYPGLGEAVRDHHADWNASVRLALDPPEGVDVDVVHPDGDLGLGRFTRDLDRIRGGIAAGREDGRAHLRARERGAGAPAGSEPAATPA